MPLSKCTHQSSPPIIDLYCSYSSNDKYSCKSGRLSNNNSNEEEEDDDDDGSGSDDDDNDNSKKHESDNDTVDEEVGKENTKPPKKEKVRKESKDQLNVSKKESRKNKSPKKKIIDITSAPFPKSVSGFVNLIEDEMNNTGKRNSEINLVDEDDGIKKQKTINE